MNTSPPSLNSPAQVRGQLIGQEDGIPVLRIDELTYLPKLAGSTPRRTAKASPSGSPTPARRLFGGRKRKSDDAADDATDLTSDAGPSSPSKRARGNTGPNTLLHKLQTAAATAPSPPPADHTSPPIVSTSPPPAASATTSPLPASLPTRTATRSAGKR